MTRFFYVYILQSEAESQRFYTGLTNDLRTRLKAHNSGRIIHTAKWKPWRLKTYIALSDRISRGSARALPEIRFRSRVYKITSVAF